MDEEKGIRISNYKFYKGTDGFIIIDPERKIKKFKNPREAAVYFSGAIESMTLNKCLALIDKWGYNIYTGAKKDGKA